MYEEFKEQVFCKKNILPNDWLLELPENFLTKAIWHQKSNSKRSVYKMYYQFEKVKHDGRMDGQTDKGNNNIPKLEGVSIISLYRTPFTMYLIGLNHNEKLS